MSVWRAALRGRRGFRAHVLAVLGAPRVLDDPVVLAALAAVAHHQHGVVDGHLAARRVEDAALVRMPVLCRVSGFRV